MLHCYSIVMVHDKFHYARLATVRGIEDYASFIYGRCMVCHCDVMREQCTAGVLFVQMVYKSCPDLSRLTTGSVPVVDTETEYHAAYRLSTDQHDYYSNTGHTAGAAGGGGGGGAAAAAGAKDENNNNDDDVNEVCLNVCSVIIDGLA